MRDAEPGTARPLDLMLEEGEGDLQRVAGLAGHQAHTQAMTPLVLFLDFDGVLHPLFDYSADRSRVRIYTGPLFVHAQTLADALDPFQGCLEIVISSTWARKRSLGELRQLLPNSVSAFVVGATWHDGVRAEATRYEQLAEWLQRCRPNQGERWLALDDDTRGWPAHARGHLVESLEPLDEFRTRLKVALGGPLTSQPETP